MSELTAAKTRYSVVPIEYNAARDRQAAENILVATYAAKRLHDADLTIAYADLAGNAACTLYEIIRQENERVLAFFEGVSACIILEHKDQSWPVTEAAIRSELLERARLHSVVIQDHAASPVHGVIAALRAAEPTSTRSRATVNYVFTFYCFDVEVESVSSCDSLLSIMAEPSLVDLDDMQYEAGRTGLTFNDAKADFRAELHDCDVSSASKTYITWATIVSALHCDERTSARSKTLLLSLELRLQIVWNRCFVLSRTIDGIFAGERTHKLSDLYLSFSTAIDSARSLQSATLSTRASRFLDEMILTSRLATECDRLQQKIDLLEKYLLERQSLSNDKYQRVIQLFLVLLAIGQIVPLFFAVPLTSNHAVGEVALGALLFFAALSILRGGRSWR